MLASKNRLTASQDIERVVKSGTRVRTKIMTIYSAPSQEGRIRFACVAGKKVHKSAIVRHAVQRKLRAACRERVTSLEGSYDIVVVALTPTIRSMSLQEISGELIHGLETVGIRARNNHI
jgi:ribonuclease P protein component